VQQSRYQTNHRAKEKFPDVLAIDFENCATNMPISKRYFDKRVAFFLKRVIELIHRALRCCFGNAKQKILTLVCDALEVQECCTFINHS